MLTLNCKGKLLHSNRPVVMGVLNLTPDSFFSGSRMDSVQAVVDCAGKMLEEGASIIDVGGQSTRPGSEVVSAKEELERISEGIEALCRHFPEIIISADTYHSEVARGAVSAGASIINDISGGEMDENMLTTVGELNVPFICMHMQGTPQTMQLNPHYENVVREVLDYFIKKVEQCRKADIRDVIIDPGFGFGKHPEHNYRLLKNLNVFQMLERPVLAGLSRKSMIYKLLKITPEEALNGTTALNTIALMNGAAILRVHDVKEAMEVIKLTEFLKNSDLND